MWVWVNSGSWWWTGRPGVLQSMESQRVGHDWLTELNWLLYLLWWLVISSLWCYYWDLLKAQLMVILAVQKLARFIRSQLFIFIFISFTWGSVYFSCSVVSNSLRPQGLQHARLPRPSPTPRACSNSCPSSQWCHPTISSSIVTFSSCLQSFPASWSFPVSHFFTSGGQSIGVSASASVLPVNIQDWFPSGWTGQISLQSEGLSRVFSNTAVQKHQFFGAQLSL